MRAAFGVFHPIPFVIQIKSGDKGDLDGIVHRNIGMCKPALTQQVQFAIVKHNSAVCGQTKPNLEGVKVFLISSHGVDITVLVVELRL